MKFAWVLICVVAVGFSKQLPENFKICRLNIPDYDECLKDALYSALNQLKDGLPEIDVPSIEPLEIPGLSLNKSQHTLVLKNTKIYNLSQLKILSLNTTVHNKEEFVLFSEVRSDILQATSDYIIQGNLLLFKLDSGGKTVFTLRDVVIEVSMKGVAVQRKNYSHYNLTELNFYMKPRSVTYQLDDIVRGNQELSAIVNKALNDNWEVLLEELQPLLQKGLGQYFIVYANNIFKYIPNQYI